MLFRIAASPVHISSYIVWSRPHTSESVDICDSPILSILILHSLMDLVAALPAHVSRSMHRWKVDFSRGKDRLMEERERERETGFIKKRWSRRIGNGKEKEIYFFSEEELDIVRPHYASARRCRGGFFCFCFCLVLFRKRVWYRRPQYAPAYQPCYMIFYQWSDSHNTRVLHIDMSRNTLQHAAAHCNTLQHTKKEHTAAKKENTLVLHIDMWQNTLQRTAARCSTRQHTATQCNTLQRRRRIPKSSR